MKKSTFHLSLPCKSVSFTRNFYVDILGAKLGRNTHQWIDIDLLGHQITFTKSGAFNFDYRSYKFEDTILPSFHFGVVVEKETYDDLYQRLLHSDYEITTQVTFLESKVGQHTSFFITDPNHYTIEFKCFLDNKELFKS